MERVYIRIIASLLVASALLPASAALAQSTGNDPLPYLLVRDDQHLLSSPAQRVETEISRQEYALPGTPVLLSTGASWSPVRQLSVRAGVNSASMAPCANGPDDDCSWALADPQPPEEVGFNVGASWQPLEALTVDLDYMSGPALVPDGVRVDDTLSAFGIKEDLSLSCRFDAAAWGDLELGLRLSRWNNTSPTPEEPEASAAIGVAWELGAFRGDVTSRYMEMVGGPEPIWNTFDISFAWRTPWNARLSVGATNVLDAEAPAATALDDTRVEEFLGRVPYVRYQQDL